MRSRDLPITRSARVAAPTGNAWRDRGDHVAWDAPGCRKAYFAHRLELDRAPDDPAPWFARWQEEHGGKGVGRAILVWETPLDEVPGPLPERLAPIRMLGMAHDGPAPRVKPIPVPLRAARADELPAVAAATAAQEPAYGPGYRTYLEWLYPGLAAVGGRTLAAWDGDRPVAALTVVRGEGVTRFQEVWTDRAWRGRGLASALVARALADGGLHLLATVEGSDAERLYRKLGFRPVSRMVEISIATE